MKETKKQLMLKLLKEYKRSFCLTQGDTFHQNPMADQWQNDVQKKLLKKYNSMYADGVTIYGPVPLNQTQVQTFTNYAKKQHGHYARIDYTPDRKHPFTGNKVTFLDSDEENIGDLVHLLLKEGTLL